MKIAPIKPNSQVKSCAPIKFIKAFYYANKPVGIYRPDFQPIGKKQSVFNKFIDWIKTLFN